GLAMSVLQIERRQEARVVNTIQPLLDSIQDMDTATMQLLAASRGYTLAKESSYLDQYDAAIRNFNKANVQAQEVAVEPRHQQSGADFRREFETIRSGTDQQIIAARDNKLELAAMFMSEAAKVRRSSPDYAGLVEQSLKKSETADLQRIFNVRQSLTALLI